jgi:hypothetical protein
VKSTEIALEKAAAEVKGSVLASDAFFPFSWGDSVEMACKVRGQLLYCWAGFTLITEVAVGVKGSVPVTHSSPSAGGTAWRWHAR